MIENPIPWANGARCAVAFTFEMDAESLLHLNLRETAPTRVALSSMLRHGPEIAVPRILALFARCGLKQTFFVPGWCIETYPDMVEQILRGGHEIGHHGYLHVTAEGRWTPRSDRIPYYVKPLFENFGV
ncbi:hypothetical protein CYK37_00165 [Mesorhizobium loti]|nr:polysaccharide deacetylase family protein [Mesorhizobium loti]PLP60772.1 hypothetical protein CYK37_00165 [Mesorhizobium loti]